MNPTLDVPPRKIDRWFEKQAEMNGNRWSVRHQAQVPQEVHPPTEDLTVEDLKMLKYYFDNVDPDMPRPMPTKWEQRGGYKNWHSNLFRGKHGQAQC